MRCLKPLLIAAGLATALTACAPVTQLQGYQAIDAKPADIKVGDDTKTSVQTKLGSPTTVSTFDPNVWYYLNEVTDQFGAFAPRTRTRDVVAITFDKTSGKVTEVKTLTAADGRQVALNTRETPTTGRELNMWAQLFSTLDAMTLPRQDDDPGRRPGQ